MKYGFSFIFCLLTGFACFCQNEIDYQNKRLTGSLNKNGISGFSELEEISCNSTELSELKGKFFRVTDNQEKSEVKYVFVGRVNSCRSGGCSISGHVPDDIDSEYFEYFIFFDSAKTVRLVNVYNYQATHGYEITSKGWLKQFAGFSGNDTLEVNKNIDGISGATISVYAITKDVQIKSKLLKSID